MARHLQPPRHVRHRLVKALRAASSLAETFVRGTVIYRALFMAMRLLPRRAIGSVGASDVLVIVLISETVSNAMQGGADTLTDGLQLATER